ADLQEIIVGFDAIMVARGDLGVVLPLAEVRVVERSAIDLARRWAEPVNVAPHVLESMIENARPTRAQTSDCANAVRGGADAVMLSGETSIGKCTVLTVQTMAKIITSIENPSLHRMPPLGTRPGTRGGAAAGAAVDIAASLEIPFLVSFTQSGDS